MFQQFVIRNFRCFSGLHLKQLERVNLIAGKTNTGKTALLEAVHLHNNPANWPLPIEINKLRGIEEPIKALKDVCGWLFWQKHVADGLHLESWDDKGITRSLEMLILDAATARERFPEAEKAFSGGYIPGATRLILKYEQTNEAERVSIGAGTGSGQGPGNTASAWVGARIPWSVPSVYLNSGVAASAQDVKFFGELEAAKRHEEILPALRILEPRLQRLSLVPLAGESVIHGDIGLPRLVPLPFMGEGLRRILSIVLAIANAPGGVVLIDEVEYGLHYSVMKDVWKAIALMARKVDAQVFATTHSYECITAANEAFTANGPYDLRLYRLDRINDEIQVAAYDQEILSYAAEMSHEVR
jgi:hypothetical protein